MSVNNGDSVSITTIEITSCTTLELTNGMVEMSWLIIVTSAFARLTT